MERAKKDILVFTHRLELEEPKVMSTLTATPVRGRGSFAFEYTAECTMFKLLYNKIGALVPANKKEFDYSAVCPT